MGPVGGNSCGATKIIRESSNKIFEKVVNTQLNLKCNTTFEEGCQKRTEKENIEYSIKILGTLNYQFIFAL